MDFPCWFWVSFEKKKLNVLLGHHIPFRLTLVFFFFLKKNFQAVKEKKAGVRNSLSETDVKTHEYFFFFFEQGLLSQAELSRSNKTQVHLSKNIFTHDVLFFLFFPPIFEIFDFFPYLRRIRPFSLETIILTWIFFFILSFEFEI